jgi:predicted chitinase
MITRKLFDSLFPTKGLDPRKYNLVRERDALIDALNRILPKYGITTYKRLCAYFANCGIETDYWKTSVEYASGQAYEGRRDLGNTHKGDGRRFKGRSPMQTTGRYNYEQVQKAIGEDLGIDVVENPELLAEIEIGVEASCIFWRDHKLNDWADAGAFKQLSGIVNRGDKNKLPLHWPKRLALYKQLLAKFPKDLVLLANEDPQPDQPLASPAPAPLPLVANEPAIQPTDTIPTDTVSTDTARPNIGMSLQAFSNKYLKHTPADRVKDILLKISGRIGAGVFTIWNLGVGGKILTVLISLAVLGPLVYALYSYRWRIVGWAQTVADTLLGNEQPTNA